MSLLIYYWLACAAFLQITQQASLPTDSYYTAGVVEFHPAQLGPLTSTLTATQQIQNNLDDYLNIISSEEAAQTDIIVFPESALNSIDEQTFVPDPEDLIVPCDLAAAENIYHKLLVDISCQAKRNAKYVVINITEKQKCLNDSSIDPRPCASNGLNTFNTNVVFDRNGTVISRYRKVNLFGEPKNTTYQPEHSYFDTDFGVRFGHFICFDILFYTPAQAMVQEMGIKDFVFPTMWFSQLPFLTGVQFQFSWSYANDVNLLAAGASYPPVGTTGTGIFNGKHGSLVRVMSQGEGQRKLYVAQVPKYAQPKQRHRRDLRNVMIMPVLSENDIFLKRDYLENYESVLLNLTQTNAVQRQLCYQQTFCCNFDLSWQPLNTSNNSFYYKYRLGVYDGWRKEAADSETNQLKNCALFTCIGEDIMDCGKTFPANVTQELQPQVRFERIAIEAAFPKTNEYLLMPNSVREQDLLPLQAGEFEWREIAENETHRVVSFHLNTTEADNLLAFSIYANYFNGSTNGTKPGGGGSSAIAGAFMLVATACIFVSALV